MKRKPFTTVVLQEAENLSFLSNQERQQVIGITIDGDTSLDLDDAIWIEPRQQDALISVHIADPTALILPDTPLDQMVLERIETLYLKHGNDPMLPHILSEDRLSLLENQPRPTISIYILVNEAGEIKDTRLELSFLSNLKQFTYTKADQALVDPSSPYFTLLRYCETWAQKLNYARSSTGAIGGTYCGGLYLNEDGSIEVITYKSHQIIQEFMVLANRAIANLAQEAQLPIVYRNQTASAIAPDQKMMLNTVLSLGVPELIRKRLQSWLNAAEYAPFLIGHFALALPAYTHFTSPIRRLADYINHRIIKAVLIEKKESPYSLETIRDICHKINQHRQDTRIARDEYFTQQSQRKLLQMSTSNAQFSNISDKEFSEIIKIATQKKTLANISEEILQRLKANRLKPVDYYHLTFFDYQEKLEIQENILEYLEDHPNLVSQYLQIAAQLKQVELRFIDVEISAQNYAVWAVFEEKTTVKPGLDRSKLTAKHKASFLWIDNYLKGQLVGLNQRELPQEETINEHLEISEIDNPIGNLNDHLTKLKLTPPKYNFTAKGGEWECECRVNYYQGRQIRQIYQASSKKEAKQTVALLVLRELGLISLN